MAYMEAVMLGTGLAGGLYLFALLIGKFAESSIENKPDVVAAAAAIPRRAMLENRFEQRKGELGSEIARLNIETATLRRRRFTLDKELADARREAESPVRVVGREGSTPIHFRAWLINRQVQNALSEGKQHPTLDSSWATPQIVEIWADNLDDARRDVQRIFPLPLGFSILNIKLELPADALPAVKSGG